MNANLAAHHALAPLMARNCDTLKTWWTCSRVGLALRLPSRVENFLYLKHIKLKQFGYISSHLTFAKLLKLFFFAFAPPKVHLRHKTFEYANSTANGFAAEP